MKVIKDEMKFEYHYSILGDHAHLNNAVDTFEGAYDFMLDGKNLSILDAGANIGAFTLWAMRRFPNSTFVCYEPIPKLYDVLEENVSYYGVETHMKAISTEKDLVLNIDYSLPDAAGKNFQSQNVEQISVETVHPKDVGCFDLVKMNVEGAETDIIPNMDLSKTYVVMVESHSDEKRRVIEECLYSQGFVLRQSKFMMCCGSECYQRPELPEDKFRNLFLPDSEMRNVLK